MACPHPSRFSFAFARLPLSSDVHSYFDITCFFFFPIGSLALMWTSLLGLLFFAFFALLRPGWGRESKQHFEMNHEAMFQGKHVKTMTRKGQRGRLIDKNAYASFLTTHVISGSSSPSPFLCLCNNLLCDTTNLSNIGLFHRVSVFLSVFFSFIDYCVKEGMYIVGVDTLKEEKGVGSKDTIWARKRARKMLLQGWMRDKMIDNFGRNCHKFSQFLFFITLGRDEGE